MLITNDLFASFIKCETKSFLRAVQNGATSSGSLDTQSPVLNDYKNKCWLRLIERTNEEDRVVGNPSTNDLRSKRYALILDCVLGTKEIQSTFQALQRSAAIAGKPQEYIPIRFASTEKVSKDDKLVLAFGALVMSMTIGQTPVFGKIIHGVDCRTTKVDLSPLVKIARTIVERISIQLTSKSAPELILNRHCSECEFRPTCHQAAKEKDELSLLARMTVKERKKLHSRGIFSVTQLSHTFRPRRRPNWFSGRPKKHDLALQALSIREQKIHTNGKPELNVVGTPVYLDVESVPDRQFYYLIGLRTSHSGQNLQYSYWADDPLQERDIWSSFLKTLRKLKAPQLVHYGNHEKQFLKRMTERYGLDKARYSSALIDNSLNLLSVIYGSIYFPTYSNGLKEISNYLGCGWSDANASGFQSLRWRAEWEISHDEDLKRKLITYNAEDCTALERVSNTIRRLCDGSPSPNCSNSHKDEVISVDSLRRQYPQRFGKIDFALPELESINKAAYWDYQRNRVYLRTQPRLKRILKREHHTSIRAEGLNKTVVLPAPPRCPTCEAVEFYKHGRYSKTVYDLRFGKSSIKRWVVKYRSHRYRCFHCKAPSGLSDGFLSEERSVLT
jgi:predicted RecB family nuclease